MQNFIMCIEEVIDKPEDPDIWIVFESESDLHEFESLHKLLWNIQFNPYMSSIKKYSIDHSSFYQILMKDHGKEILASLIYKTCSFLKNVSESGAIYGNLRSENLLIKFNNTRTKIERIKFLCFGHVTEVDSA